MSKTTIVGYPRIEETKASLLNMVKVAKEIREE